jgi:Putative abortive phage resistance protein AbiGi, antitoxin
MSEYVSDLLTHFAGASLPDDEARYNLLATILNSGKLLDGRFLNRRRLPIFHFDVREKDGSFTRIDYFPEPYFELDFSAPATSDEAVRPEMVCLCDIPLEPAYLRIHTSKYGQFGVALDRSFLVERGAAPVQYIPISAKTVVRAKRDGKFSGIFDKAAGQSLFTLGTPRGAYIGKLRERHLQLVIERKEAAEREHDRYKNGEIDRQTYYRNVVEALDYAVGSWAYLFGLHKRFDAQLPKNHRDSYYMEREWRVLGTVSFSLEDVARIIVPQAYASRLRTEFPLLASKVLEL